MSKAFTSEEPQEAVPLGREPPLPRPGELRWITPEGQAALRAELARVRAAAAGEERTRRLLFLERTLGAVTVLGPEGGPDGEVGFGSWVTLEDQRGGRRTWRIVGPDEADASRGSVSAASPLGQALLGRSVGEEVRLERPAGALEYTICEIHRSPPPA
jgi:transcription elongation factor GreB